MDYDIPKDGDFQTLLEDPGKMDYDVPKDGDFQTLLEDPGKMDYDVPLKDGDFQTLLEDPGNCDWTCYGNCNGDRHCQEECTGCNFKW